MLFGFPRLTTTYLPRKPALRFASTVSLLSAALPSISKLDLHNFASFLLPLSSLLKMAAKVALEKNHHHLKVDQKEENPIDWKAVKAHISFVASKYKANVSRATLLSMWGSAPRYTSR